MPASSPAPRARTACGIWRRRNRTERRTQRRDAESAEEPQRKPKDCSCVLCAYLCALCVSALNPHLPSPLLSRSDELNAETQRAQRNRRENQKTVLVFSALISALSASLR